MAEHYSAPGIEQRLLGAIRLAGLDPDTRLVPEALGALDHFHMGGRRATVELLDLARMTADDRVLDVGAGIGGAARLIASTHGCRVVCVERSRDYCAGARLLNRLTGLDDRVEVHEASALALPFPAGSFDVVWMQNVGMSIEDKPRLYAEIRRVLVRGGRFVFQEVAAGDAGEPYFPVPWATDPRESFLVPVAGFRPAIEKSGFVTDVFEDVTETELTQPVVRPEASTLTLAVFVPDIGVKAKNSRRSFDERRIRLVRGVFRAV